MGLYEVSDFLLEEQRALLHPWMHFTIYENTGLEILLRIIAKPLIFRQYSLEHRINPLETLVVCIFMPVDFVFHRRMVFRSWDTSHHVEEMGPGSRQYENVTISG